MVENINEILEAHMEWLEDNANDKRLVLYKFDLNNMVPWC